MAIARLSPVLQEAKRRMLLAAVIFVAFVMVEAIIWVALIGYSYIPIALPIDPPAQYVFIVLFGHLAGFAAGLVSVLTAVLMIAVVVMVLVTGTFMPKMKPND